MADAPSPTAPAPPSPTLRPGPARVAAPERTWRGLDATIAGASLQARPFSARERATLAARAHHVVIGEETTLIPWHDPALDARALAWAHALAASGEPAALREAARLVAWIHADPASRDAAAVAELALAATWRARAGSSPSARPTLRTGVALWNGRRVRLGWRDRVETVNPLWIDVHQAQWQGLVGRYEACAAAAARLGIAGPTLLLTAGGGAAREATRWLADDAAGGGAVHVRDLAGQRDDPDAAAALLRDCTTWLLATPLDDETRLDGTFAAWMAAFGGEGDDAPDDLRLLVGVDLRPDQLRVQRELHAAATTLDAAEACWRALGGATCHERPSDSAADGAVVPAPPAQPRAPEDAR